jgi:serine/threonine-protein phosphatase 2B regulatory subunit
MGSVNETTSNNGDITLNRKDLCKLYKRFKRLDTENTGEISPEDLLDIPSLSSNPVIKRIVEIIDTNENGKISFIEFLNTLSVLSDSAHRTEKLRFAFRIYDYDKDGFIDKNDLYNVVKMMVGNNLNENQIKQLVDRTIFKADIDKDGKLNFEEFCEAMISHGVVDKLTLHFD